MDKWRDETVPESHFLTFMLEFTSFDRWYHFLSTPTDHPYGLLTFNIWDRMTVEEGNIIHSLTYRRFYLEGAFQENPMANPLKHEDDWRWVKNKLATVNGMNFSEIPPGLMDPYNYCFDGRIKPILQALPMSVIIAYRHLSELHYAKPFEEINTPLTTEGNWIQMHQYFDMSYSPHPDDHLWLTDDEDEGALLIEVSGIQALEHVNDGFHNLGIQDEEELQEPEVDVPQDVPDWVEPEYPAYVNLLMNLEEPDFVHGAGFGQFIDPLLIPIMEQVGDPGLEEEELESFGNFAPTVVLEWNEDDESETSVRAGSSPGENSSEIRVIEYHQSFDSAAGSSVKE
ncbi:hypothetical protein M5689_018965 [Euphorbia peplus]|nr:hypothetical protein M5689_018965 [Euphorbia peplus]